MAGKRRKRRNKTKFLFFLMFFSVLLWTGCVEVDPGISLEADAGIKENADISAIEIPDTVSIYETEYWTPDENALCEVLLKGDQRGKENLYDGIESYTAVYEGRKEKLYIEAVEGGFGGISYDRGLTEQEQERYGASSILQGIFDYKSNFAHDDQRETTTYLTMTRIQGEQMDGEEFTRASDAVENVMDTLHLPECQIRSAAPIITRDGETRVWLMYWQQVVNEIPLSDVYFDDFSSYPTTYVYNRDLDYDHGMIQNENTMQIYVLGGDVISWNTGVIVIPVKTLKKEKVVSPQTAYQKVKEVYAKRGAEGHPRLEFAELQYKSIEKNGRGLLVPVWLFAISEDEPMMEKHPIVPGKVWYYYLIDAVSGDFFTSVDAYLE